MEQRNNSLVAAIPSMSDEQQQRLAAYAEAILRENAFYNLTGHKTIEAITEDLIYRSILPLKSLDVPRGIFAVDIGTGAGVPGIPLAIAFPNINWTLIDSNEKKTAFISSFAKNAGITNVDVLTGRAEEFGRMPNMRQRFSLAVSRAVAGPYICAELAAPFLQVGGVCCLYSSLTYISLPTAVKEHIMACGLTHTTVDVLWRSAENEAIDTAGCCDSLQYRGEDLLVFTKQAPTPQHIPRRYAVIKREAARAM